GLLGILLPSVLRPVLGCRRIAPTDGPGTIEKSGAMTLTIKGMTCSHCVSAVRRALEECPGVASAAVDLARGRAAVAGTDLDGSSLVRAVTDLGYAAQADEGDEGRHAGA
ncbi:MAG: heavy-metal-associated domain-containing protein, partial [Phycisphaerae bacterium]|nr:heavy-metal-associated domain-containing protein [Phycisphaerae bacterium]